MIASYFSATSSSFSLVCTMDAVKMFSVPSQQSVRTLCDSPMLPKLKFKNSSDNQTSQGLNSYHIVQTGYDMQIKSTWNCSLCTNFRDLRIKFVSFHSKKGLEFTLLRGIIRTFYNPALFNFHRPSSQRQSSHAWNRDIKLKIYDRHQFVCMLTLSSFLKSRSILFLNKKKFLPKIDDEATRIKSPDSHATSAFLPAFMLL